MRYRTWLLAITLSLGAPQSAFAQPSDAHAAAEEKFRQGREALERADYKLALEMFQKSQALEAGRGKLLNIAICEEKLGRLTEATRHILELLPQLAPDDERRTIARKQLTALEARTPHLRIDLAASSPPDTTVSADGSPVPKAALGTEIPYNPGKHAISVAAPGRAERRYELSLEEGQRAVLPVEPGLVVVVAGTGNVGAASPAPTTSSRRTVGFVVGGVGLAGLGVGAITGILSLGDHASALEACPLKVKCSTAVVDQAKAGQSLSVVSTVAFAAGAAAAGVGLYLVLSSGKSPASAAASQLGVTLLPGGGSLGIHGFF